MMHEFILKYLLVGSLWLQCLYGILSHSSYCELFVPHFQIVGSDIVAVGVGLLPEQCNGCGSGSMSVDSDG